MYFLFPEHQERFNQFIEIDGTHPYDVERRALFYVISGCGDLAERIGFIYDFGESSIRPEAFEEIDLTRGTKALLELAFNLSGDTLLSSKGFLLITFR